MMSPADAVFLAKSLEALKRKIEGGFDPNTQDTFGDTVLHFALRGRSAARTKVVRFLIDKVDITIANKKGDTLLGAAVIGGNLDIVKKLLSRGATLSDRENPLFYMAHTQCPKESYDAAKLLLEKGLVDDKRIQTALARAREEGDKKLVKLLGGDIEKPKKERAVAPVKRKAPPPLAIRKKNLTTSKAREKALDKIGVWFVDALLAAGTDPKKATTAITTAIRAFYDVRESADQERGEYAGHFFLADAVGLGESDRPVPWEELEKQASVKDLGVWEKLFAKIEPKVS